MTMTDPAITQRRDDFTRGAMWAYPAHAELRRLGVEHWVAAIEARAAVEFPAPLRPRVLTVGATQYRIVDGQLETRRLGMPDSIWVAFPGAVEEIRAIADLLDDPTEPDEAVRRSQ